MVPRGDGVETLMRTSESDAEERTDWIRLRSADFTGALTMILRLVKRGRLLRLWFSEGALRFQCGSCSLDVPAEGSWRGEVTAPAGDFKAVLKMREKFPEVMEIRRSGSQLDFDHYTLRCSWSETATRKTRGPR